MLKSLQNLKIQQLLNIYNQMHILTMQQSYPSKKFAIFNANIKGRGKV